MTTEMRESFHPFMFIHLGDEIPCGPDSKLARTLLLMGDAEKTLKSAHENCAQRPLIFDECLIVTLTLNHKELRDIAHRQLRGERSGHTLQSTALVHEAYLRLMNQGAPETQNRAHFVAVAARLMRQILIDYARSRGAQKRGANLRVELEQGDDPTAMSPKQGADIIALDDALKNLSERDRQQAQIVEMRYFGGLTIDETAEVLKISPATVKRDWSMARAWLAREMQKGVRGESGKTRAVEEP